MFRGDCSICVNLGELNNKGIPICSRCRDLNLWEIKKEVMEVPAVSKKQQEFFGMVESGKIPAPKGMSPKQVNDFAATSKMGLPEKAKGGVPTKPRIGKGKVK